MRSSSDERIPLLTKTLYGAGSIASGVKDTAFNIFLLFFYTQVAGLSGSLAGAAIFIALLLDAVSDPLVGYWSDRLNSRWGRRHPFIYASALPMAIAFWFLFNPPLDGGQTQLFIWMLTWAVLVRFFMTFFTVPAGALNAEMTSNYDERTSISGFRVLLAWVGGIAFSTVGYIVFFAPSDQFEDGRLDPNAYQDFALLGAIMIVAGILVCARGTHHMIPRLKEISLNAGESQGFRQDMSNMLHNKPFLVLASIILVAASAIGFTEVIGLYLYTYFWGVSTDQMAVVAFAALIGTIMAFLLAPPLSARFDKRPVAIAAASILVICYPTLISLRILEVLPPNSDPVIPMLLYANAAITVFGAVGLTILFASMVADTVDKNELITGRRQEAIYTSAFTFSLKATSGIGGFIAGIVLDLISFPQGVDASEVAQETLISLGTTVAFIIAGSWFLTGFIMRYYNLSRDEHAKILTEVMRVRSGNSL